MREIPRFTALSMHFRFILSFFLVVAAAGCSGPGDGTESGSTASSDSLKGFANEGESTIASVEEQGIEGRWQLFVMKPQVIIPALIVDLKPGDAPEIVSDGPFTTGWKIEDGEASDDGFVATFLNSNGDPVKIVTSFDKGRILRGYAAYGVDQVDYVELTPTEKSEIGAEAKQIPTEAIREIQAKVAAKQPFDRDDALKLIERIGTSPTTFLVYQVAIQDGLTNGADVDQIINDAKAMVDAEEPWGAKKVEFAATELLTLLTSLREVSAEELRAMVKRTEEAAGDDPSAKTEIVLEVANAAAAVRDPETPLDEARAAVASMQERSPFDPMTLEFRKAIVERGGDDEELLRLAAEWVALPIGGANLEEAKELFVKVRGSEDGFDDYIRSIYDEKIIDFADDAAEVEDVGASRVLIELFTGGSCPPCVSADVALEAVAKAFPENAVVLRYHMDVPAPDPLAVNGGESRYTAYQLQGTPSLVVNGVPRQIPGLIGPYQMAKAGFRNLSYLVKELSNEPSRAKVDAIAVRDDESVRVVVTSSNIPASFKAKAVVVLAAKSLSLDMPNGIREHGMVVRALPAGAVGTGQDDSASTDEANAEEPEAAETADGSAGDELPPPPAAEETYGFNIVTETNLSELKEKLVKAVRVADSVVDEHRDVMTDLSDLKAVVFLQDSNTGQVIAVTQVDVLNEADLPADATEALPAKAAEESSEKSSAAKPEMKAEEPTKQVGPTKASAEKPTDTAEKPADTSDESKAAKSPEKETSAKPEPKESAKEKPAAKPEPTPAES